MREGDIHKISVGNLYWIVVGNRLSVYEVVGNGSNQGVISGGRGVRRISCVEQAGRQTKVSNVATHSHYYITNI